METLLMENEMKIPTKEKRKLETNKISVNDFGHVSDIYMIKQRSMWRSRVK